MAHSLHQGVGSAERGFARLADLDARDVFLLKPGAVVGRGARVEGFDEAGNPITLEGTGLMAQALQHECDHLIGVLYPMRVRDFSRFGYTDVLFPGLDATDD